MKRTYTLAVAFFAGALVFAQNNPTKVVAGKKGMYPEMIRFDKSGPDFANAPVLFNEATNELALGQAKKLGSDVDKLGFETFRYKQVINGIPVEYGVMNVHTKNGKIVGQTGNWVKDTPNGLEKKVNISESNALSSALAFVGAESYKWQDTAEEEFIKKESKNSDASFAPKGEMVYYSDPSSETPNVLTLAYKFDIYAQKPLSRQYVFVDAKSGEVLGTEQLIHETNAPGTAVTGYSGSQPIVADSYNGSYRLRETGRNGGTAVETYNLKKSTSYSAAVDFTDTDNNWNNVNTALDQYATDAHWGAEKTLDYFYAKFGRKSIDNNNFAIKSYVHYSSNYFNAFWDGSRMTYGDGSATDNYKPLTAIDVCGHEITHGMTSKTANLAYQKESGAMNEGFSDIFGNAIEAFARPTKNSWLIGEDFYTIRSMSNPNAYSQPDTYLGTYWKDVAKCRPTSNNDQCGVHTNSGVLNFWFYLLTQGGTGTNDKGFSYNVSGLGIDKAAAIAYRTLTTYLTSSSTYANARTYSLQAAADLYGAGGAEVNQVKNAWNAVGVGGGTSAAGKIAANVKPAYTVTSVTNDLFTVNFESETPELKTVNLISTSGKNMVTVSAKSVEGTNRMEVRVPASANTGVYYVVVNGEKAGAIIRK